MKHTLSGYVEPTAQKLAASLGLELVDVELVKRIRGVFSGFSWISPQAWIWTRWSGFTAASCH